MELEIYINLIDKNGIEWELPVIVDFDGRFSSLGISEMPNADNTTIISVHYGIDWDDFDLLCECHFTDYRPEVVFDMVLDAVNDELALIYEEQYL